MNPAQQLCSTSDKQVAPFCCGYTRLHKGEPCSTLFTSKYYQAMRDSCAEMARGELDSVIMGQIMALTSCDETTREDSHRHPGKQRQQVKTNYYHKGHPICWKTFTHLHGIGIAIANCNVKHLKSFCRQRQAPEYPPALYPCWIAT